MTGTLPSVDEVCERAFQEMLRKQGRLLALTVSSFDASPSSSSRDMSHEVFLDPTIDFNVQTVRVPSSNNLNNNVELGKRNDLVQELNRIREDLVNTQRKLVESEASVRSYKAQVIEFGKLKINNNCDCEKLKIDINHLKVELLSLKNENKSLKSACARNVTSGFDLDKILIGQKPSDKSGLGFKKEIGYKPVLSRPKDQKVKRELNQPKISRGSAFMYRDYSKDKSLKSRTFKSHSINNNRFHYSHNTQQKHESNYGFTTNRLYKRGPNGYFYELVDTHVPRKIQSHGSKHRAPKHYTKTHQKQVLSTPNYVSKTNNNFVFRSNGTTLRSNGPKSDNNSKTFSKTTVFSAKSTVPSLRKEEYTNHYKSHFIKGIDKTSNLTCAFCNFCCKIGHISLECPFRKTNTTLKFMWMRKDRNTASGSSSSKEEVSKST